MFVVIVAGWHGQGNPYGPFESKKEAEKVLFKAGFRKRKEVEPFYRGKPVFFVKRLGGPKLLGGIEDKLFAHIKLLKKEIV